MRARELNLIRITPTHRVAASVMTAINTVGVLFIVWGLVVLDVWIVLSVSRSMAGKNWFQDRMAILYDDVAPAQPTRSSSKLTVRTARIETQPCGYPAGASRRARPIVLMRRRRFPW